MVLSTSAMRPWLWGNAGHPAGRPCHGGVGGPIGIRQADGGEPQKPPPSRQRRVRQPHHLDPKRGDSRRRPIVPAYSVVCTMDCFALFHPTMMAEDSAACRGKQQGAHHRLVGLSGSARSRSSPSSTASFPAVVPGGVVRAGCRNNHPPSGEQGRPRSHRQAKGGGLVDGHPWAWSAWFALADVGHE